MLLGSDAELPIDGQLVPVDRNMLDPVIGCVVEHHRARMVELPAVARSRCTGRRVDIGSAPGAGDLLNGDGRSPLNDGLSNHDVKVWIGLEDHAEETAQALGIEVFRISRLFNGHVWCEKSRDGLDVVAVPGRGPALYVRFGNGSLRRSWCCCQNECCKKDRHISDLRIHSWISH